MDNSTVHPKQKLKELYQALRDKPLDPADEQDAKWYVPYVEELPSDPIMEIFDEIKVFVSKRVELESQDRLSELAQLFDRHFIIHYKNGKDWYDIHPLIKEDVIERQRELDEGQTEQQG